MVRQRVVPLQTMLPESMRYKGHKPPGDLSAVKLEDGQREMLERQSLEIFTLMANAGKPFAECLSAILLSGIHWGINVHKEV